MRRKSGRADRARKPAAGATISAPLPTVDPVKENASEVRFSGVPTVLQRDADLCSPTPMSCPTCSVQMVGALQVESTPDF